MEKVSSFEIGTHLQNWTWCHDLEDHMSEQNLSLQFSTLDLKLKNALPIIVHKKFIEICEHILCVPLTMELYCFTILKGPNIINNYKVLFLRAYNVYETWSFRLTT
jgi:hypothetical protein